MADGTHDADTDVIVSGREPRRRSRRPGGLVWLLVGVQAAALAVTVAVAVHYRAEARGLRPGGPAAAGLTASPMPAAPFPAGHAPCAALP